MTSSATLERPQTDRRSRARARTDARIAEAIVELIQTRGPAAVTIEAVSARSGVARTTLYRRYKDRYELMAGFIEKIVPLPEIPQEPTREGLTELINSLLRIFRSRIGLRTVGHMLASGEEFLAGWRETIMAPRLALMHQFFRRGMVAGVFRSDLDPQQVVEMIAGAVVFGSMTRGNLPEDWADNLVATIWLTVATNS